MSMYRVVIRGCDDSTEFEVELTEEERTGVERVAHLSRENSTCGCEPDMHVKAVEVEA